MKKKKELSLFYLIWREGKYVDFWNIPHFLISLLISFIFIFLHLSLFYALFGIIVLKTIWEIYEHIYVTKEVYSNKVCDVLTGILAVLISYLLLPLDFINLDIFILTLLISILFGSWGLYSMKKLDLFIKKK